MLHRNQTNTKDRSFLTMLTYVSVIFLYLKEVVFWERKRPLEPLGCSVVDPGCLSRILIFTYFRSRIHRHRNQTND